MWGHQLKRPDVRGRTLAGQGGFLWHCLGVPVAQGSKPQIQPERLPNEGVLTS